MLLRTHLAITLFFILLLVPFDSGLFLFVPVALIATMLPDIDTKFSKIGRHFKLLNFFMKHRGAIHSFSFLLVISVFIFLLFRQVFFPFVLGYSSHLIADSMTLSGIKPFYPLKFRVKGMIKTRG